MARGKPATAAQRAAYEKIMGPPQTDPKASSGGVDAGASGEKKRAAEIKPASFFGIMAAEQVEEVGEEKTGKVPKTEEVEQPSGGRGKAPTTRVQGKPSATVPTTAEMDNFIKERSTKSVVAGTGKRYVSKIYSLKEWMKKV